MTSRPFAPVLTTLTALLTSAALVACSANPGPAPTEDPAPPPVADTTVSQATTAAEPETGRSTLSAGVLPLRNGLNPHLLSDINPTVQSIAHMVLPSTFRDGQLDTDILESAQLVDPPSEAVAQTVEYQIQQSAQWSDGAPITGNDFVYLWAGMTTTPAVVNSFGYEMISNIRITNGGRTVFVDFRQPVQHWQGLFNNLLPSHLAQSDGSDFATAFADGLPASASRFMVNRVDRARGVVTLHRNDRFWGVDPAPTDIVQLIELRSTAQAADLLRSGQVGFIDTIPEQTSVETYELIPGSQVRLIDGRRQLQLVLSTSSPLLADHARRRELVSLIDVELLARQAAQRTAHLAPARQLPTVERPEELMLPDVTTKRRPLRVAADPADPAATGAARAAVDSLAEVGITAEMVVSDLNDIAGQRLPEGTVDAVVTWADIDDEAMATSTWLSCEADLPETTVTEDPAEAPTAGAEVDPGHTTTFGRSPEPTPQPEDGEDSDPRLGNLSGFCTLTTQQRLQAGLAGAVPPEQVIEQNWNTIAFEHLLVPILQEQRVAVLGEGIVGPDPDLHEWPAGLETAASWEAATREE